VKRW
jgi:deazaflavin-dependent oxidoreductase (nitroreductase family)